MVLHLDDETPEQRAVSEAKIALREFQSEAFQHRIFQGQFQPHTLQRFFELLDAYQSLAGPEGKAPPLDYDFVEHTLLESLANTPDQSRQLVLRLFEMLHNGIVGFGSVRGSQVARAHASRLADAVDATVWPELRLSIACLHVDISLRLAEITGRRDSRQARLEEFFREADKAIAATAESDLAVALELRRAKGLALAAMHDEDASKGWTKDAAVQALNAVEAEARRAGMEDVAFEAAAEREALLNPPPPQPLPDEVQEWLKSKAETEVERIIRAELARLNAKHKPDVT